MPTWDEVIEDLRSLDDVDRYVAACEALDRMAGPRRLAQLRHLLINGRDFTIREAAAVPVARLEGVSALPMLLRAARLNAAEGHDNDGLNTTITGVVESDPVSAAPLLAGLLRSTADEDRADAASLWGYIADMAGPAAMFEAARDPSPRVRANALGSLGSFKGRDDVLSVLCDGLADADPSVRVSAVSALGYYGDRRALPAIDGLAADPDPNVRRFVEYARGLLTAERPHA